MYQRTRRFGVLRIRLGPAIAGALIAFLLFGSSADAGGITVLQFTQFDSVDVVTATKSGGVVTLSSANADGGGVSIPVVITNFLGVSGVNILAFETYMNVTSSGSALIRGWL